MSTEVHKVEIGVKRPMVRTTSARGNRLLQIFWNVSMQYSHPMLAEIAKKHGGVDVAGLAPGEMVMFVNSSKDRIKILAGTPEENGHGVIAYYRSPGRGRIDMQALQYVAQAFNGGENIGYEKALKKSLQERLKPKRRAAAESEEN